MSSDDLVVESEPDSDSNEDQPARVRRTKLFERRKLPWRSQEFENVIKRLDKKTKRNRTSRGSSMILDRREEQPSKREPPVDASSWAVVRIS